MIFDFFRKKNSRLQKTIAKPFSEINEIIIPEGEHIIPVIYDPALLQHRKKSTDDLWWLVENNETPIKEVAEGNIAIINSANTAIKDFRFSSQFELTEYEKEYAVQLLEPIGVKVISGKLYIGSAETLLGQDPSLGEGGVCIKVPPGVYDLTFYSIDTLELYSIEDEVCINIRKTTPDVVIFIKPRTSVFTPLTSMPYLNDSENLKFLFPSKERAKRKQLKIGTILKAKIWKDGKTPPTLVLKQHERSRSWEKYQVILEDISELKWKDRILLKIIDINKKSKIIKTQFAGYFEE